MANRIEVALAHQEKFQLYFVSLVFTLLALSIQSARFGLNVVSDCAELIGWLALLVCGLATLWYLELVPFGFKYLQDKEEYAELDRLRVAAKVRAGASPSIEDRQRDVAAIDSRIAQLDRSLAVRYTTARWSFLLGVLAVVVARGYPALFHLVR